MKIAYLENSSIDFKDRYLTLMGTLRVEIYNQTRAVLFMHVFRHIESDAADKVMGIFGYSSPEERLPDRDETLDLLKLYFDDKGFITDIEAITPEQAKQIRLDIIKAMPDPKPLPPKRR